MTGKTNIEWATHQWNPIVGCSVVSPGCTNCYAMRMAGTRLRETEAYRNLTADSKSGPVWTGAVRLLEERLDDPLRWRKPKDGSRLRVFVNSMGDLFHDHVQHSWAVSVFQAMIDAPQHDFLVLTKRAHNMRSFVRFCLPPKLLDRWPPTNVWLGVSVEDQARADDRIPVLIDTPASIRFVSYEPALGPVDFGRWLACRKSTGLAEWVSDGDRNAIDWVIVGGESGPRARPFDLKWARQAIDQCRAAGVPCFVKQIGSCAYSDIAYGLRCFTRDKKGSDFAELPEELRVREFPA